MCKYSSVLTYFKYNSIARLFSSWNNKHWQLFKWHLPAQRSEILSETVCKLNKTKLVEKVIFYEQLCGFFSHSSPSMWIPSDGCMFHDRTGGWNKWNAAGSVESWWCGRLWNSPSPGGEGGEWGGGGTPAPKTPENPQRIWSCYQIQQRIFWCLDLVFRHVQIVHSNLP